MAAAEREVVVDHLKLAVRHELVLENGRHLECEGTAVRTLEVAENEHLHGSVLRTHDNALRFRYERLWILGAFDRHRLHRRGASTPVHDDPCNRGDADDGKESEN